MIISRWILLTMRNISDKICRENQNTHFMFDNLFFRKSFRLWDNVENMWWADRPKMTTQFVCRITKKRIQIHTHNILYKFFHNYSNIYPKRCNVTQFIISGNCSTCFGWYLHLLSGAHTTVSTTSGICHTVAATCRYRGRVGTGLSVL